MLSGLSLDKKIGKYIAGRTSQSLKADVHTLDSDGVILDPSKVIQSESSETDINRIMDRFERTGQIPGSAMRPAPHYGDFSAVGDFASSMNVVVNAKRMFDALPVKIRNRFGNNPAELLKFVDDKSNFEEAVKLGLLKAATAVSDVGVVSPSLSTPTASINETGAKQT